jgi:hypothetical protein
MDTLPYHESAIQHRMESGPRLRFHRRCLQRASYGLPELWETVLQELVKVCNHLEWRDVPTVEGDA